jgi:hypothetical protein
LFGDYNKFRNYSFSSDPSEEPRTKIEVPLSFFSLLSPNPVGKASLFIPLIHYPSVDSIIIKCSCDKSVC